VVNRWSSQDRLARPLHPLIALYASAVSVAGRDHEGIFRSRYECCPAAAKPGKRWIYGQGLPNEHSKTFVTEPISCWHSVIVGPIDLSPQAGVDIPGVLVQTGGSGAKLACPGFAPLIGFAHKSGRLPIIDGRPQRSQTHPPKRT
jgi:hypothetical protein